MMRNPVKRTKSVVIQRMKRSRKVAINRKGWGGGGGGRLEKD